MKKIFVVILAFASLTSCNKQDDITRLGTKTSNSPEDEYQFTHEIEVTDINNENSVYFAVRSNDEDYLNAYLDHFEFNIEIGGEVNSSLSMPTNSKKSEPLDLKNYSLNEEPKIVFDLIAENIKVKEFGFSLVTKVNSMKSSNGDYYRWDLPVGYFTNGDFIGVFMYGDGYGMYMKFRGKENWYSWSYQDYTDLFYMSAGSRDAAWWGSGDPHKRGCVVYRYDEQSYVNYKVAYSKENFRGDQCSLGHYDGRNCFVKAAPVGTKAFLFPNDTGYLYYSKASGNNPCPAGGYFDGANCQVAKIPSGTTGFVYHNNLYVYADKIVD